MKTKIWAYPILFLTLGLLTIAVPRAFVFADTMTQSVATGNTSIGFTQNTSPLTLFLGEPGVTSPNLPAGVVNQFVVSAVVAESSGTAGCSAPSKLTVTIVDATGTPYAEFSNTANSANFTTPQYFAVNFTADDFVLGSDSVNINIGVVSTDPNCTYSIYGGTDYAIHDENSAYTWGVGGAPSFNGAHSTYDFPAFQIVTKNEVVTSDPFGLGAAVASPSVGCSGYSYSIFGADVGNAVCQTASFLFVPQQSDLNQFTSTQSTLSETPPFSYLYELGASLQIASTTEASITPLTLTIGGSGQPLNFSFDAFSSNTIDKYTTPDVRSVLRTIMSWALYLAFVSMVIFEVRHMFKPKPQA